MQRWNFWIKLFIGSTVVFVIMNKGIERGFGTINNYKVNGKNDYLYRYLL
jgi:hypothetical protein